MGDAAATEFPYTLCFGPLRYRTGDGRVGPNHELHQPCTSPAYTLHAYLGRLDGPPKRTLCGARIGKDWVLRKALPKTECAHCQRIQGRWYGTHG